MTPKTIRPFRLIAGSSLLLLSACVTGHDSSQPFGRDASPEMATSVLNVLPAARPTPDVSEATADTSPDATRTFPYEDGTRYRLHAAAGSPSTIALEPGEVLVSYAAADDAKWVIRDIMTGNQTRLQIEPTEPDLSTRLVINTDKRSYLVEATSRQGAVADAAIAWTYRAAPFGRPAALAAADSEPGNAEAETGFSLLADRLRGLSRAPANEPRGCRLCRDSNDHGENDHGTGHDSADHH